MMKDDPRSNGSRRRLDLLGAFGDVGELVERFNLRRVYQWLGLATLVGVIGGIAALCFKWLADTVLELFWGVIISFEPPSAGGEITQVTPIDSLHLWGLVVAPAIGGLISGFLVYRFAPQAAGHGTDAAIRAFHRGRGIIPPKIAVVKLLASAVTLGSGGSAGREGPIAQIGAGFGSALGAILRVPERQRRILLAAGLAAGIGAIFRAPFAGAIFAAEVLYREPDIEAEVVVPALLSSIVSYTIYCEVHGFGHLFTGTTGFAFVDPRSLLCYTVLGLATAFAGIAFVTLLSSATRAFQRWRITNYAKPAIGGAAVGVIALGGYLIARDTAALSVMGSGYGTLQSAVSEWSAVGPSLAILAFVAIGKMVTTSLTIGSGGSGGVFGPSMVIGGCVGAAVGTLFHMWMPTIVPDVGPFTIVGMAGFFAGVAKTPISTLLMVGELTGNYSLLLPSMLVVAISMIITHRWTIYPEQVRTRAESPAHRDELLHDVFADLRVAAVFDRDRTWLVVAPGTSLRDIVSLAETSTQRLFPVVGESGTLLGGISIDEARSILSENPAPGLIRAGDLMNVPSVAVFPEDPAQRALDLLSLRDVEQVPVVSEQRRYLGLLDRADILDAYRRRVEDLRATR